MAGTAKSYIDSYDDTEVHELMLRDAPRTLAYKHFFERHRSFFEGKVVMDVGSGTGILSMFAARAGARKVYAVEASSMVHLSRRIIHKNHLHDVIQVVHGRVEEVVVHEKVDVIVSEWMGFYLLHESMLASVLVARDRFLKPDGLMLPSSATLYAAPVSLQSLRKKQDLFWRHLYGFDFSDVVDDLFESRMLHSPQTTTLAPSDLLSPPRVVAVVNMKHADVGDFDKVCASASFKMHKHAVLRGVSLWFDALFCLEEDEEECMDTSSSEVADTNSGNNAMVPTDNATITLSTSPLAAPTHWKQTTILLPSPLLVSPGGSFDCRLELQRGAGEEGRSYHVTLVIPQDEDADLTCDDDDCVNGDDDDCVNGDDDDCVNGDDDCLIADDKTRELLLETIRKGK